MAKMLICCICGLLFTSAEPNETGTTEVLVSSSEARLPVGLEVYPAAVSISSARDRQAIVAQLKYSDEITLDVSSDLQCEIENPDLVQFTGGVFEGIKNGSTMARIRYQDFEVSIPISIANVSVDPEISFKNDVIPVFSKVGCNAGSCHGAARGKDGFRLSLYGFDPAGDYFRLTREMPGRRIDLALPDECLLIAKATGGVSHTGGALIKPDSDFHKMMLRWLDEGAKNDRGPIPTVEKIELYPKDGLLNGQGASQQLTVVARYSDGTDRDVTSLALFFVQQR